MSGILAIVGIDGAATGGFNPVTHPFPNNGTYTETIPTGATNIAIELYGASAIGQRGNVSAGTQGGGGGSGGYARSTYTVAALGGVGKTFTITVAAAGTSSNTTIAAGTVTGFTAMTAPAGSAGTIGGPSSDGTGGAAGATGTGGTVTNSKGNAGQNGGVTGYGGAGVVGVIGSGRPGGDGTYTASTNPGGDGYAYFYYT